MIRKQLGQILFIFLVSLSTAACASSDGLIKKKSPYSVAETIDRLEGAIKKTPIFIAKRIDHAANAKSVNQAIPAVQLLLFGSAKVGTPLIAENPTIGIDLPMKALAYKDAKGDVWLIYNDPAYLVKRHGVTKPEIVKKLTNVLNKLSEEAIAK